MDNSTTFQGNGEVTYIPVVVNGKQARRIMESKCFSCKNKNVKTSYGYTVCNYSGSECRNFELYDPIKKTNGDNFRAMTDEELAEWIGDNIDCSICKKEVFKTTTCPGSLTAFGKDCYGCWLDWLKQEAE